MPSFGVYVCDMLVFVYMCVETTGWGWYLPQSLPPYFLLTLKILFYVYGSFAYMYMCAPRVCLVPVEAGRGHWIPWSWSYRCLWGITWVLGSEPRSSARATSPLITGPSLQPPNKVFCWTWSSPLWLDLIGHLLTQHAWPFFKNYFF